VRESYRANHIKRSVFTQPGSKAASTAPQRHFRYAPINGHQPTGAAGPFRAKADMKKEPRRPRWLLVIELH